MTQFLNRMVYSEPFDILFRNFFDNDAFFQPAIESKPKYPVNISETDKGLDFEIAVVGLSEEDLDIEIKDGDTLTISYEKPELLEDEIESDDEINWIHKGIAQRSFSLGWKIGNKFDLDKISASVDKGLLSMHIPISPDKKPKKINLIAKQPKQLKK